MPLNCNFKGHFVLQLDLKWAMLEMSEATGKVIVHCDIDLLYSKVKFKLPRKYH